MSGAGDRFEIGVQEVRTLLSLCSLSESETARNNAVSRASTVLLVSHFESLVKSVAEEFMDSVASGAIESRSIPIGIRELHSIPRMEEILACGDRAQRATLLRKITEYGCLWVPEAKPPAGLLKASALVRKVTSADHLVVDEVFDLMGAASPVCDGDIDVDLEDDGVPSPVNIRLMLRDVIQCRNDIAHGDADRIPTRKDVERYIRQLEALSRRLEARTAQLANAVLAR